MRAVAPRRAYRAKALECHPDRVPPDRREEAHAKYESQHSSHSHVVPSTAAVLLPPDQREEAKGMSVDPPMHMCVDMRIDVCVDMRIDTCVRTSV